MTVRTKIYRIRKWNKCYWYRWKCLNTVAFLTDLSTATSVENIGICYLKFHRKCSRWLIYTIYESSVEMWPIDHFTVAIFSPREPHNKLMLARRLKFSPKKPLRLPTHTQYQKDLVRLRSINSAGTKDGGVLINIMKFKFSLDLSQNNYLEESFSRQFVMTRVHSSEYSSHINNRNNNNSNNNNHINNNNNNSNNSNNNNNNNNRNNTNNNSNSSSSSNSNNSSNSSYSSNNNNISNNNIGAVGSEENNIESSSSMCGVDLDDPLLDISLFSFLGWNQGWESTSVEPLFNMETYHHDDETMQACNFLLNEFTDPHGCMVNIKFYQILWDGNIPQGCMVNIISSNFMGWKHFLNKNKRGREHFILR